MNALRLWHRVLVLTAACLAWSGTSAAQGGPGVTAAGPDVMHPPKISVDLKEASLKDLAAALNTQLGGDFVRTQALGPAGEQKLTLKVQDQPFWDILLQAHKQTPLPFSVPGSAVDERTGMIILSPMMGRTPHEVSVTDGVCTVPLTAGNPTTGNWELRCWIYTDPRIRLSYCMSDLQVEKAIDQDGRALSTIPALIPGLSGRKQAGWSPRPMAFCSAAFAAAPGLKMIKELRGSAAVEIIETTETLKFDLTQEQKEPVASAIGKFTVQKGTDGEYTVTLAPAADAGAAEPGAAKRTAGTVVDVRMIDNEGGIQPAPNIAGHKSWTLRPFNKTLTPARLEIVICLKARETTLPVVFKDLPVPENPAPLPRRR